MDVLITLGFYAVCFLAAFAVMMSVAGLFKVTSFILSRWYFWAGLIGWGGYLYLDMVG